MTDVNSQAAKNLYREVRAFSERTKGWDVAVFHDVLPDELWDATLVSQRVYGRRDEFLVVMAAAGIDTVDQPLPQRQIILPTEGQLYTLKRRSGFESLDDYRENGKPTWDN
ncbi:MAG: hypothetical protein ACXWT0_00195 [Methylobacter sp.]